MKRHRLAALPVLVLLPAAAAAQAGAPPLLEEAGTAAIREALAGQTAALERMRAEARAVGNRMERWRQLADDLASGRVHAREILDRHGGITVPPGATYHPTCDLSAYTEELAVAVFTVGPEWPPAVRHAHHEVLEALHMPGRASEAVRATMREALERSPARRALEEALAFYRARGFQYRESHGIGVGEGVFTHPRPHENATRAELQFPGAGFMRERIGCGAVPHSTLLLVTRTDFPDAVWGGAVTTPDASPATERLLAAVLGAWQDLQHPAGLREAEELERLGVAMHAARRARNAAWLAGQRAELGDAIERYRRAAAAGGG
jgi:hypothetical protein